MFVIDCVTVNVDAARHSAHFIRSWLFATNADIATTVRARDDRVTGLLLLRLHLNSHLDKEGEGKEGKRREGEQGGGGSTAHKNPRLLHFHPSLQGDLFQWNWSFPVNVGLTQIIV